MGGWLAVADRAASLAVQSDWLGLDPSDALPRAVHQGLSPCACCRAAPPRALLSTGPASGLFTGSCVFRKVVAFLVLTSKSSKVEAARPFRGLRQERAPCHFLHVMVPVTSQKVWEGPRRGRVLGLCSRGPLQRGPVHLGGVSSVSGFFRSVCASVFDAHPRPLCHLSCPFNTQI